MNRDEYEDRTTDLLRQALTDEAAMVEPGPGGLQEIQARTADSQAASRRTRRRWMLVTPLGAGLAAAAVIFGIVVLNGGSNNGTDGTPPVSQSKHHQGVYDPDAPASEQVTVWYVGTKSSNPAVHARLFAERHTVTSPGANMQLAAVRELLTATPIDSDYNNPWFDAGVDGADISETSNGTTIFDLDGTGSPNNLSLLQVESLARTAGLDPGSAFMVQFAGDSGHALAWMASPDADWRPFITIDNIVDGQTVSNPVTVQVSGNVFEGNVNWTLLDASGDKVDEGYVTTSMGMWTQAPVELGTLDPGAYTFKAFELSAEDGHVINLDDKTFTVE